MLTYGDDPDVIRWGLNLLDGDLDNSSNYCGSSTLHEANYYNDPYPSEGHHVHYASVVATEGDIEHTNVENDEMIAHAFQEELSQLAVAEASGSANVGDEHLQASILAQDWLGPSSRNYFSGNRTVVGSVFLFCYTFSISLSLLFPFSDFDHIHFCM